MSGFGAAFAALNIAGRLSGVSGALKAIPPKVWYALAAVALLLGGYLYHRHRAHQHDAALVKATIEQRDGQWRARLAKEHTTALEWKAKADQERAMIAQDERTKHDEDLRLNAAAADALRLRGAGAASAAHCGQSDHPGLAAAPDRYGQAVAAAGATTTQVPSDDRAIVSWNWLVRIAQEHDDLLADVKTVIEADKKQRANWPSEAATPR